MASRKIENSSQSFKTLRTQNAVYVDKTQYLLDLIDDNKFYLLSRPRRFGKSLTLSTFESLFEGEKELFQGLAAAKWFDRPDYKPYTVISLDMSSVTIEFGAKRMEGQLISALNICAKFKKISPKSKESSTAFADLIADAFLLNNEQVVLLIDEYDKPLLDSIDNPENYNETRKILQNFYSQIKVLDEYIKFGFVVGISKRGKAGISSVLNNFRDITYEEKYSRICGFTEEELKGCLSPSITECAEMLGRSFDDLLLEIKKYYYGYSFDGVTRVYTPYSILSFLKTGKFSNFWYDTATPTFLKKYFFDKKILIEDFINYRIGSPRFLYPEEFYDDPALYLFQTGYLTIKEKINDTTYLLDYPNEEVLASISRLIADSFFSDLDKAQKSFSNITAALEACDIVATTAEFNIVIDGCGYDTNAELAKVKGLKSEFLYRDLIAIFLYGTYKVDVCRESLGAKGRTDLLLKYAGRTFIFEIKVAYASNEIAKKLEEAITQIHERKYANWQFFTTDIVDAVAVVIDN
ncbi:MAG: ATP-binding protein [Desulfovibrio sp.]|jgi:hypothetical protein|nr:ATP-binding protein [Desulfovibrio sp.]